MEQQQSPLLAPITLPLCPLCGMPLDERYKEAHLIVHERAEMLADILALSRR